MINKESKNKKRIKRHMHIRQKISGTALRPRLVVFRSIKSIRVQAIDDEKAATIASFDSKTLKLKHNNIETAKIVGKKISDICKEKNIKKVVFDRNGYLFHGRVKALADAARENGLEF